MDNPIVNGLFVFVLGISVVFLGMIIIVLSVSICGKLMNKTANPPKKEEVVAQPIKTEPVEDKNEEIPTHVKAAIIAAISAYYFNQKSDCDFIVRKIRRF
ncbi:MAG: OadG family protein [Clostridia bacterium]|nr:OadG family protein [Clostridia bacterium]